MGTILQVSATIAIGAIVRCYWGKSPPFPMTSRLKYADQGTNSRIGAMILTMGAMVVQYEW